MFLAAILFYGILTLWVQPRWALASFQVALFALAIVTILQRRLRVGFHPIGVLIGVAALWGLLQIALHRTVYELRTWDAVLNWSVNLVSFSLASAYSAKASRREKLLHSVLWFAFLMSILATVTVLSSPPGKAFWIFEVPAARTFGPFVYRNQYAAFVESVLPLAIFRAILDRRRSILYIVIAATLFASVIAAGSRAGSALCFVLLIATPAIAYKQRLISGRTLVRVVGAGAAAVVLVTAVAGWETIWNRLQEPNPYAVRAELVRSSLQMIRDRPLTGFGLGTWSDAYPAYARFDDGNFVNQAHNDWVQWAVEGGVPFFLVMLSIVIWSVKPAVRSLWGIGVLTVFIHCLVDYPMQQRPALAAFFFALLGTFADSYRPTIK